MNDPVADSIEALLSEFRRMRDERDVLALTLQSTTESLAKMAVTCVDLMDALRQSTSTILAAKKELEKSSRQS